MEKRRCGAEMNKRGSLARLQDCLAASAGDGFSRSDLGSGKESLFDGSTHHGKGSYQPPLESDHLAERIGTPCRSSLHMISLQ